MDGWGFGKNLMTMEKGMFPMNFVSPYQPTILQVDKS
jgi:hypothetical protein